MLDPRLRSVCPGLDAVSRQSPLVNPSTSVPMCMFPLLGPTTLIWTEKTELLVLATGASLIVFEGVGLAFLESFGFVF